MPRLNEGLQKYGQTILKRKASRNKHEQLKQHIAASRSEETQKLSASYIHEVAFLKIITNLVFIEVSRF